MRTIALSLLVFSLLAADLDTPYTRIAKLASYISAGDTVGALETFDKSLANYGRISEYLTALSTQADVLCAIQVVADKEADDAKADVHHLDLDWYMTLKSRAGIPARQTEAAPGPGSSGHDAAVRRKMAHHRALAGFDTCSAHDKVRCCNKVLDHTKRIIALTLICAVPVLGGADDEWQTLYSLALNAACCPGLRESGRHLQPGVAGRRAVRQSGSESGVHTTGDWRACSGRKSICLKRKRMRSCGKHTTSPRIPAIRAPEYARAAFTLAGILSDEGKYQPALDAVRRALPLIEGSLGPRDTVTADAICMEGDAFRLLRMYASAQPPLRRCADMRADSNGVNTAEFGEAANSLATVYQHLGQYKEADRYFTYAAKIREVTLGITSPALADTLEAHALLLRQLGRDGEAKQKERMAAAIRAHTGSK